ncbi:MAG: hypothetical protein D6738_15320 [Acidobacteria bacterium]|nr:MAG: hypothetical protein D6738_15320 [Acidobacteriota bacterium]
MKNFSGVILAALVGLAGLPALAHEVDHRVERRDAFVITFEESDGEPFAAAQVEVRRAGSDDIVATGVTDRDGVFAFVPPAPGRYAVRASSADGHGDVFTLDAGARDAGTVVAASGTGRGARLIAGAGLLLAVFGAWSLWRSRTR